MFLGRRITELSYLLHTPKLEYKDKQDIKAQEIQHTNKQTRTLFLSSALTPALANRLHDNTGNSIMAGTHRVCTIFLPKTVYVFGTKSLWIHSLSMKKPSQVPLQGSCSGMCSFVRVMNTCSYTVWTYVV